MTRSYDTQTSKVYAAENEFRQVLDRQYDYPIIELAGSRIVVPLERKFGQLENIQRYVDQVCYIMGIARAPHVRERKGQTIAHFEYLKNQIAIPTLDRWAMREVVVLHELAHAMSDLEENHGQQFMINMLDLVEKMMGDEARLMLTIMFHERGAFSGKVA